MRNILKNKNMRRLLGFILIFCLLYAAAAQLLTVNDKRDTLHIKGLYLEPENSIDVALIGPSEFYTGFNSPLAWEKYGFTSYSLTFSGIPGTLYESMLTEYLKQQQPQLVVFEVNAFIYSDNYYKREAKLHTWIDNIPWSQNKLDTIEKCVPPEQRYSYFFKMSKYHSNWKRPFACVEGFVGRIKMDMAGCSYTKSFSTVTQRNHDKPEKFKVEFTAKSEKCLRELLSYCQERQLKNVLFVRFPHRLNTENPEVYDKIEAVIREYDYDFLNLENAYSEIGLDEHDDFYNNNHMNIAGMQKLTPFFSQFICEHYHLNKDHPPAVTEQWNLCAAKMDQVVAACEASLAKEEKKTFYETAAY